MSPSSVGQSPSRTNPFKPLSPIRVTSLACRMDVPAGPVLPGPNDERSRSPWRRKYGLRMVASISQLADNVLTMRSFHDVSRRDHFDRGPGTPDVILNQAQRPGSSFQGSSLLRGMSIPKEVSGRQESQSQYPSSSLPSFSPNGHCISGESHCMPANEVQGVQLVMPSARRASAMILNDSSPPLSPVNDGRPQCISGSMTNHMTSPISSPEATLRTHNGINQPFSPFFFDEGVARGAMADTNVKAKKHDHSWADFWPTLSTRPSPPSSLDSNAPSLTWSLSSHEDESTEPCTLHVATQPKFQFGLGILGRAFTSSAQERADIDPSSQSITWEKIAPHAAKVVLLGITFLLATFMLGLAMSTLPLHMPTHLAQLTLSEIRDMCQNLRDYAASSNGAMIHVFLVLTLFFCWKQAFCVPGSLITNIIYGAMYGSYAGSLFASIFTAVGGIMCYFLAAPFADVVTLLPSLSKPLHSMRLALHKVHQQEGPTSLDGGVSHVSRGSQSGGDLWSYLLFLRLLPIVPYGMMNISCGVLGVPLLPYAITLGIGSVPWNFCTAQVGELLQDVATAIQESARVSAANSPDGLAAPSSKEASLLASGTLSVLLEHLWTWDMIIKLLLLSVASTLPIVLQRFFGSRKTHSSDDENIQIEEDSPDYEMR